MNITSHRTFFPRLNPPQTTVKKEEGWIPPPKDDASNLTKALRALPSAVAGMAIVGTGAAFQTARSAPGMFLDAAKALKDTPKLGTNLKWMTGALLPFAAAGAVVLSPAVGALYGLCSGFYYGAEKGVSGAVNHALHDVGLYRDEVHSTHEGIISEQTATLGEGQKPIEVELGAAAKGLSGGLLTGTVMTGATALMSAGYVVPAMVRGEYELWKGDTPLPFKVVGTPIMPLGIALASGLAPVAAGLWGLGRGAKDSYEKGYAESLTHTKAELTKVHDVVHKAIFN
ncbi:hypothetical protein IV102_18580 [bacterium]|nr:hypothetical protein [bacterium]